MPGSLEVLNVGSGHLTLTYDRADSIERERARRMVTDMLRRGYAIFVELDAVLTPVREFDEARGVYIVADVPGLMDVEPGQPPAPAERAEGFTVADANRRRPPATDAPPAPAQCPKCHRPRHRGRCRREVPMEKAKATAVGRTAGG